MTTPTIVSAAEWDAARDKLLVHEKELTRARDRMAALDITALGRQEEWEDSPGGHPQTPPYAWWRWHDDYAG